MTYFGSKIILFFNTFFKKKLFKDFNQIFSLKNYSTIKIQNSHSINEKYIPYHLS